MTRELCSIVLFAATSRVPLIILIGGGGLLLLTLFYLMVSRRGDRKSLTQCVVLSVWAHVVLVVCAYFTTGLPGRLGGRLGASRSDQAVEWVDDLEWSDAILSTAHAAAEITENARNEPAVAVHDSMVAALVETPPNSIDEDRQEPAVATDSAHAMPTHESLPETPPVAPPDDNVGESPVVEDEPVPSLPDAEHSDAAVPPSELPAEVADADAQQVLAATETEVSSEPTLSAPAISEDGTASATAESNAVEPSERTAADPFAADLKPAWTTAIVRADRHGLGHQLGLSPRRNVVPEKYRGRDSQQRHQLAMTRGGSLSTEAAVEHGLAWLAAAQDATQGCWETVKWGGGNETRELVGHQTTGIQADTATTGLALLAYLGAGYTHQAGPYQPQVQSGLDYLLRQQSPATGSLQGNASRYVAMYCHGIATLALSEALVMTDDPRLRPPLERAVRFTISCQHPTTGGWRYQRGDRGDTSQFGWQLMALVSARAAGIAVPDQTFASAEKWLQTVRLGAAGGLACYTPERRLASGSMTAEAMVCRNFLELPATTAADEEAARYLVEQGARPDSARDFYFMYYATLALYPRQDTRWQVWNERMTQQLLQSQNGRGSLAGSWDPDTRWGATGGRVYTTAMACLCLETYYRYLPVYGLAMEKSRSSLRR